MKNINAYLKLLLLMMAIITLFVRFDCKKDEKETSYEWENPDDDVVPKFTIYPETGDANMTFEFDASSSENTLGIDSLWFKWDWEGDGIYDTEYSKNPKAYHQYGMAGSYNVKLCATGHPYSSISYTAVKILTVTPIGADLATVVTHVVADAGVNMATCGGEVTDEGSTLVTSRGVCWNLTGNPTVYDDKTADGGGPGVFISIMRGLLADTVHYLRAYATSSAGAAYGEQRVFRTDPIVVGPCPGTPTVSWQGQTYNTAQIGDQCWMKENLNWETGNSWCYDDDPSNCEIFGRLYNWETMMNGALSSNSIPSGVQGICPPGWHIPSDEEWKILEGCVDGSYRYGDPEWDRLGFNIGNLAGKHLKSTTHWIFHGGADTYGFTGLPGGFRFESGSFNPKNVEARFWSSTAYNSFGAYLHSLTDFADTWEQIHHNWKSKDEGYSVRCVKD
jgi:uncharacterized protein (TIGR02145 family)